jgi:hypothetical protein
MWNVIQEVDLPPDRMYLFGYHPHGACYGPKLLTIAECAHVPGIIGM